MGRSQIIPWDAILGQTDVVICLVIFGRCSEWGLVYLAQQTIMHAALHSIKGDMPPIYGRPHISLLNSPWNYASNQPQKEKKFVYKLISLEYLPPFQLWADFIVV